MKQGESSGFELQGLSDEGVGFKTWRPKLQTDGQHSTHR